MRIFKTIFRIDHESSFAMMDRPGTLARLMVEALGDRKFFDDVAEDRRSREITARFAREQIFRQLKAGPTVVLFNYINLNGIEPDSLKDDPVFSKLVALVSSIRAEFQIQAELRLGFRTFYLATLSEERRRTRGAFQSLLNDDVLKSVTKALAEPKDVGFGFDGGRDDGVQYHVRCGPFLGVPEASKYFEYQLETPPDVFSTADFICDIDQFQEKTKFGKDLAWWKPCWKSANNLVRDLTAVVRRRAEG